MEDKGITYTMSGCPICGTQLVEIGGEDVCPHCQPKRVKKGRSKTKAERGVGSGPKKDSTKEGGEKLAGEMIPGLPDGELNWIKGVMGRREDNDVKHMEVKVGQEAGVADGNGNGDGTDGDDGGERGTNRSVNR